MTAAPHTRPCCSYLSSSTPSLTYTAHLTTFGTDFSCGEGSPVRCLRENHVAASNYLASPREAGSGHSKNQRDMEQLLKEHERLEKKANLGKAVDDVQKIIDELKATRDAVAEDPSRATELFEAQQKISKIGFDRVNDDLKEVHSGLNKYSKALEKKFKDRPLPFADHDTLASQTSLINRAIAMHLLREGHFDVAATFISEANASSPTNSMDTDSTSASSSATVVDGHMAMMSSLAQTRTVRDVDPSKQAWEADFSPSARKSASLQQQFSEMYHILDSLRQHQNLEPAISWARTHSAVLEARGSNLEYDLCKLQYINHFRHGGPGPAMSYARQTFSHFPARYTPQTQQLIGALAFLPNIAASPYATLFSPSNPDTTSAAASAFTAEFCALLSLSSASPLLTAVTAGCIALPTLLKLSQIQAMHRTSWTTASELPVEVPLPAAYHFHSVFVCPVSKEQSTDDNPPMMMPCHHVICKESLDRVSRGTRFKCPYCPAESHPNEASRVFL